jgi:hypothetical protein
MSALRGTFYRPASQHQFAWAGAGAATAVVIGLAAARSPGLALVLTASVALPFLLLTRISLIFGLLVGSVFIEAVDIGGVAVTRLIAPLALVVAICALLVGRASLVGDRLWLWVGAYAAWAVASGFWTVDLSGTLFLVASLAIGVTYAFAFATLIEAERDFQTVLGFLTVGALATGVYSIITYFSGGLERSGGGAGDPNLFASFQLVALPLVLVAATEANRRWLRMSYYASSLVIAASVLTSLSRGGLITMAALLLVVLVVPSRHSIFRSRTHKAVVVFAILAASAGAVKLTEQRLLPRIDEIFTTSGRTGSGRLNEWRAAWTAFEERPMLGLGYGAFPAESTALMLRTPGVDLASFELRTYGLRAHNTFLESVAELGVIGLVLFIGLLVSCGRSLRNAARLAAQANNQRLRRLANALLAALLAWSISAVFLSVQTSRSLWMLVGLSIAVVKLTRPLGAQERSLPRPPT